MHAYRYQEIAYLIVPIMLGLEFFMCAKEEKKEKNESSLGFYVLDLLGFMFTALLPAIFIFTIWAVETKAFPLQSSALARLDRYAVMFFFMGAWWQVYLFSALRARRMATGGMKKSYLWLPFLLFGVFISVLVLWVSPWNLKWISVAWFFLIFGILSLTGARLKTIEKTMWGLAVATFLFENVIFMWLESVV
jgi:hypothetical protein